MHYFSKEARFYYFSVKIGIFLTQIGSKVDRRKIFEYKFVFNFKKESKLLMVIQIIDHHWTHGSEILM